MSLNIMIQYFSEVVMSLNISRYDMLHLYLKLPVKVSPVSDHSAHLCEKWCNACEREFCLKCVYLMWNVSLTSYLICVSCGGAILGEIFKCCLAILPCGC